MIGPAGDRTGRRSAPLAGLYLATGISLVGNELTALALPWLVLTSLGTPFETGLVGAAIILPSVLGALGGGVVVDRLGGRRTSILADLASAVAVAAAPLAAATIGLSVPLLVALAFAGALLDAPGQTARQVLMPDLAERAGVGLERANGTFATIGNLAILGGPILAGLIVVVLGPANVLWLDAVSFVVSASIIAALVPRLPRRVSGQERADLGAGLRWLVRDPVIRGLTLVAAVANFVGLPLFLVLVPTLAFEAGAGPGVLGLLLGAFGIGLVTGSLAFGVAGHRVGRRRLLTAGFIVTGAALAVVAAGPPLPGVALALFVGGAASGPINPIAFTVMQERVPEEARGRVFGAVLGGVLVAAPVGMLVLGFLANAGGAGAAVAVAGLTFLVAGGAVAAWPGFGALDAVDARAATMAP